MTAKINPCIIKFAKLKNQLLMIIALSTYCAANTTGLTQYIGFGDSTLDSGYWRYNTTGDMILDGWTATAVADGNSGAYNGNGIENSIILANKFGLSATPIGTPNGSNYANGGSYTLTDKEPYTKSVSIIKQIQNYLTAVNGVANPHALYVIKSGDNDLNYQTPPPDYLSNSASALAQEVPILQAAGARTIMIPNSYNSAVYAGLGGDISNPAKYAASVSYFSLRWADLQAAGVHFIPADIDSLFKYVVHNPTIFGFTPHSVLSANGPAWNNPLTIPPGQSKFNHALWAHPLTADQQQTFLFVDDVHLTTAGQTIEADYEYSLLVAPSQISLIVESAIQNGLAIASNIQRQIDLSWKPCMINHANFWATFAPEYLRIKNAHGFPGASGVPLAGTIGIDYRTKSGAVFGMAFTAGYQKQKFSLIGGHFNQIVEAPSFYAAYKTGRFWGNIEATYSAFQNRIKRHVPLGIFTDENKARPDGSSLSLMLCLGGDFKPRQITTGPVACMILQQAHLHNFTETGNSGVTALSFASQTQNSLVSQLGWRILGDIGKWQPFAQARWNHEWGDKNNMITAQLTSVAAPAYTMAAAPVASNWADAWLGSTYQINSQATLQATFFAALFNRQITTYGGELGLNISF